MPWTASLVACCFATVARASSSSRSSNPAAALPPTV